MNVRRSIIGFFDRNPAVEPFCEIFVVILVSLGPLWIASFASIITQPAFSWNNLFGGFLSFFSSGELSLLIVSLCGSILWIAFIRDSGSGVIRKTLFGAYAFFVAPSISIAVVVPILALEIHCQIGFIICFGVYMRRVYLFGYLRRCRQR